jgi:RimJ/RimL family protein N-acetyltransferase
MFRLPVFPSNLFLRCLTEEDIPDYLKLVQRNRENVGRFVLLEAVDAVSTLQKTIREYEEIYARKQGLFLGIFCGTRFVGEIRCKLVNQSDTFYASWSCDIAYWLDVESRGGRVIYRCLRTLLPVLSCMVWAGGARIDRFTAVIERSNIASQKTVERLGFKLENTDCSLQERVLDLIAPRLLREWTLCCREKDIAQALHTAETEYISAQANKPPSSSLSESVRKERVSFLLSLNELLSTDSSVSPDFCSYTTLLEIQDVASELLSVVAPDRVMPSDRVSAASPVILDEFRGIWYDAQACDSLIIVFDKYCVKGYKQSFDGIFISGLMIHEILDRSVVLVDGESTQTWLRISTGVTGQIDGIWKSSRGYVAVAGEQYVSSSSIWELSMASRDGKWILSIGDQWSFSLESFTFDDVVWSTPIDSTILKRSARKRGNTGPIRWKRDVETSPNPETLSFVHGLTFSLRNRLILKCIEILKLEIELILKVSDPGRKIRKRLSHFVCDHRSVEDSLLLREKMVYEYEKHSEMNQYWISIMSEVSILEFTKIEDHLTIIIQRELEDEN